MNGHKPYKSIALLANAKSANGIGLLLLKNIEAVLQSKNIAHQSFVQWPRKLDDFTEAWIIGGDGTVNFFINKYPEIKIPIAVFKGGTGNDVAWKLYGDIQLEDQINLVLQATPKAVDAGRCNDRLFLNGVGIGFDGEVLKSMQTIRKFGGHLGYLLIVVKQIFTYKSPIFTITGKGGTIQKKCLLVQAFNSSRTGGGIMVSPLAKIDDGLLNIMLCDDLPILKRLKYLPIIEKGKHLTLSSIQHFTDTKLLIECNAPTKAQIDGDLVECERFEIEVLKGRFGVLW